MRRYIKYLMLLYVCFCALAIHVKGQKKKFFDYNEGLTNSLINELQQDKLGFLWVATEDGLNRFDGIKFKTFYKNDEVRNTLKNNFVTSLFKDSKDNLWVAQINSLQIYNPQKESFQTVKIINKNEQVHLFITSFVETHNGDIYLATSGHGVFKFNGSTEEMEPLMALNKHLLNSSLECILEDEDGIIWIGSNKGLFRYDISTNEVVSFSVGNKNKSLPKNEISSICSDRRGSIYIGFLSGGLARLNRNNWHVEPVYQSDNKIFEEPVKNLLFDSKDRLWVGTDGFGLKIMNFNTNRLQDFALINTPFDYYKSKVHCIIEDNTGNIWLGIFQKGIYLIPESSEIFVNYGYSAFDEYSIGSNCITDIDGNEKELWIGTDGDGIYNIDRVNHKVNHIPLVNERGEPESENILTLYNDTTDFVWIGRYIKGLICYNKKKHSFTTFSDLEKKNLKAKYDNVTVIKKNNKDQLLLGTLGDGIGRYDIKKKLFLDGLDLPDSLNAKIPKWILSIFMDNKKNLWIGSYVGMYYVDFQNKTLTHFSKENNKLPNNTVGCIDTDHFGNLWIGTYGGIVKFDPDTKQTKFYDSKDGLCNNVVSSIKEDEFHQLWISTHNGLSRFDPVNEVFTNYYSYDGIQANEFFRNSVFKSEKKELFFGGISGVTQIKSDYNRYSHKVSGIVLTDFLLSGRSVKVGEKSDKRVILNKSVVYVDTIRINERDNVFSIGFTSPEIADQSRVSYEYMMEGFDVEWHITDSKNRLATYTNLKHGVYNFFVRGVDKDQRSSVRRVIVVIYPPWYKTNLAKLLWMLLIMLFFYGVFLFYREKYKFQNAEKINDLKMQFFINISHEIKTPLSLIIDPLEKLLKQDENRKNIRFYHIMQLNANRIYRLVNQLMDVRKVDKGQILLKYQETNMYSFIKEVAQTYEVLAEEKKIAFQIHSEDESVRAWIDTFNFEKVIVNLLSNAFKHTSNGGEIFVDMYLSECHDKNVPSKECLKISISDTGPGIKDSEKEKIFDRFYQVSSSDSRNFGGTGIGLHLSRSLVNMHKGKVYAEDRKDKSGSCFVILLPLGNKHLPKEDILQEKNFVPKLASSDQSVIKEGQMLIKKARSNFKVMVIDDEVAVLKYLVEELSVYFKVVSYENGKKAHEVLLDEMPDLIVSDIMMPEMDGITFCKTVKGNIQTSHIPVILLTALSMDEDVEEGIETGADMYLVKPFKSDFLVKVIYNILENRRKTVFRAKGQPERNIENIEVESHDEIMMQKVMKIIKDNISNPDLNVEMLGKGIGISRVHMHRKLKELTNQSARDFIRNIRMKQAAYLLTTKNINVSEIAYQIGFTNLSHFSKTFKSYFGVSPSEYLAKQQLGNSEVEENNWEGIKEG